MNDRSAAPSAPKARIYDLGYKRYLGTRRSQATRWQVITREQVSQAWKKWWRFKLWLGLAVLITAIVGAILVFSRSDKMGSLRQAGAVIKLVDQLVFSSFDFYTKVCFLLTLTVGCGVIAQDLRSGAFTFYFARPVRPLDYVLGKLAALFVVQAAVILVPLLVIAGIRVGLSANRDEIVTNLQIVPKALLIGTMGALTYASLSLAFSSLFAKPWLNIAAWCGYYLILSNILIGVSFATKVSEIGCIEPHFALSSLAYSLYDVEIPGSDKLTLAGAGAGMAGLVFNILAGVGFSYWRVKSVGHAGIGGGS